MCFVTCSQMELECKGRDSNEYINAQAIANDLVFEYAKELPDSIGISKIQIL